MENKTDKPYSLQDAKDEVALKYLYISWSEIPDPPEKWLIQAAELYASKATEELRKENELLEQEHSILEDELEILQNHFNAHKKELIKYFKWEDEDSIPAINPLIELKGFVKRESLLKSEIERLKESNKQLEESSNKLADVVVSQNQSNKELVEALKKSYNYMHVFLIRNEQLLVGEKLNEDAMLVLSLLQKSEADVNKKI